MYREEKKLSRSKFGLSRKDPKQSCVHDNNKFVLTECPIRAYKVEYLNFKQSTPKRAG